MLGWILNLALGGGATVSVPAVGLGVSTNLKNNGKGGVGLMLNDGYGATGEITLGYGKSTNMTNNGVGGTGTILNDGIGKTGAL